MRETTRETRDDASRESLLEALDRATTAVAKIRAKLEAEGRIEPQAAKR